MGRAAPHKRAQRWPSQTLPESGTTTLSGTTRLGGLDVARGLRGGRASCPTGRGLRATSCRMIGAAKCSSLCTEKQPFSNGVARLRCRTPHAAGETFLAGWAHAEGLLVLSEASRLRQPPFLPPPSSTPRNSTTRERGLQWNNPAGRRAYPEPQTVRSATTAFQKEDFHPFRPPPEAPSARTSSPPSRPETRPDSADPGSRALRTLFPRAKPACGLTAVAARPLGSRAQHPFVTRSRALAHDARARSTPATARSRAFFPRGTRVHSPHISPAVHHSLGSHAPPSLRTAARGTRFCGAWQQLLFTSHREQRLPRALARRAPFLIHALGTRYRSRRARQLRLRRVCRAITWCGPKPGQFSVNSVSCLLKRSPAMGINTDASRVLTDAHS